MIRLIVNAEDFGASAATNHFTVEAHRNGIVTSTSVLGNCGDLVGVRATLAENPRLGVGLGLALTGGTPIAPRETVTSLLAPAGALHETPAEFAWTWLKGAIAPAHVERELDAQIGRARDAGLALDHLAVHGHLGFLPGVGAIVEKLARRYAIAGLRSAVEPPGLGWLAEPRRGLETAALAGLAWLMRRRLGALRHGPQTWGYLESGRLDEVRILEIIGRLDPGPHELLCHPAAKLDGADGDDGHDGASATAAASGSAAASDGTTVRDGDAPRDREVGALTSAKVKTAIAGRGIVLSRWKDLF